MASNTVTGPQHLEELYAQFVSAGSSVQAGTSERAPAEQMHAQAAVGGPHESGQPNKHLNGSAELARGGLAVPDRASCDALFQRYADTVALPEVDTVALPEVDKAISELFPGYNNSSALMRAFTAADTAGGESSTRAVHRMP
jgi:hypothetical protein